MSDSVFSGLWRRANSGAENWVNVLEIKQENDHITGKLRLYEKQPGGEEEILFESDVEGRVGAENAKIYLRTRPLHDAISLYIVERDDDRLRLLPMGHDNDLAGAWVAQ